MITPVSAAAPDTDTAWGLEPPPIFAATPEPEIMAEPEAMTEPETDPELEPTPELLGGEPDALPQQEDQQEDQEEEQEEAAEQIIAQEGAAYVRLHGARVFSDARMAPESLLGSVSGIALATARSDGDGQQSALAVMFRDEDGLWTGYVHAADAEALAYEAALAEILGDDASASGDPWPLAIVDFIKGDKEAELLAEPEPAPYVTVHWDYVGELTTGTEVELRAEVFNLAEEKIAGYRWKNNIGGEFKEVPGANEATITFFASEENTGCEWIVEVLLS